MRPIKIVFLLTILGCSKASDSILSSSENENIVDPRLDSLIITDDIDSLIVRSNFSLDSIDFNIIKYDTSNDIFPKTFKPSDLDGNEIMKCEALLKSYVDIYNAGTARTKYEKAAAANPDLKLDIKNFTINLKDYGSQYVVGISEDGTKIVYVNCFCNPEDFDYRDKELVLVFDGGECYFNFMISLTEKKIFNIWINGPA